MKTLKWFAAGALLVMSGPGSASGEDGQKWINQSGSTMTLTIATGDRISGVYRSALGCGKGKARPLTGWKNGSAWTFSVHFGECGSVTSWVGHLGEDGELATIWTLARGDSKQWNTKLTGTSLFRPVNAGGNSK